MCTAHICSRWYKCLQKHTHTHISLLLPSLCGSACVLSYLLQSVIVPTYGVSSCKPQFRGSEILLSDCHNASASGGGHGPASSLPHPPPRPKAAHYLPSLSVFLAEMLHSAAPCQDTPPAQPALGGTWRKRLSHTNNATDPRLWPTLRTVLVHPECVCRERRGFSFFLRPDDHPLTHFYT